MSVLVYIESPEGKIKKSGHEVATYAAKTAQILGTEAIGLLIGQAENAAQLGEYGLGRILQIHPSENPDFDAKSWAKLISEVALAQNASVVILTHSANGKSMAGRIAVRLEAGCISGASSLPDPGTSFAVSKSVFSGKAKVNYQIQTSTKVISLMGNTLQPEKTGGPGTVEVLDKKLDTPSVKVVSRQTSTGIVPLPEAELVVSAGRGLKGPENWGIIEDLAQSLGATTACSRPVADSGWRPHHEHVGQTGVAIRPNLYIAAGISGAIQHLAGVNNSKVIVVINKDPEAPFFKAADFGVIGDAFEVVPRLTAAIRKFKQG
ncbi:MAG: electron transfer flavoprotein subunit alpha/FixB family protein [Saprospiraceae bacterium]|nr:electron transfer flavoprotein subunit alpha/FixB family protein [Saprospiraceae bacterium]